LIYKKNQIALEDILKFCSKIEIYLKDMSKVDFENNEMVVDAVLRNLELIGEASKRLSNEFINKYLNIPWKKIIGLRNIVIHEYSDVDLDIIWDIVTKNIPETKENIQEIYHEIRNEKK